MRRFAISDIHGCVQSFQALLKSIDLKQEDELYLLGDYIDRGPNSKGVIDHIWHLQSEGFQVTCLKGNHEQMMLNALYSVESQKHWLKHGGLQTLASFKTEHLSNVAGEYIGWLRDLPHSHEVDHYILVHAGLNFKETKPMSDTVSMLWIRNWYERLNKEWLDGRIIVHGHTPILRETMEGMLANLDQQPVLDIDGGCVFREAHFRQLIAFDLDQQQLHFQDNIDGH